MDANRTTITQRPRSNTGMLALIAVLLILLVGVNGYNLYIDTQRTAVYQQRVAEVKQLTDSQRELIAGLMTSYRKDAYNNPSIDRIAEQQLLASEYSLQALQILSLQNSQIIDLLSEAR
jgi:hypothetical protein